MLLIPPLPSKAIILPVVKTACSEERDFCLYGDGVCARDPCTSFSLEAFDNGTTAFTIHVENSGDPYNISARCSTS